MPVDRFFHPRAGHSRKITLLSDFEFRVWWTYELAADDYGVMRATAVVLQAANDSLMTRSLKVVERALQKLIDVDLISVFDHQDRRYVCQLDWQDFQHVKYPRESTNPVPPASILEQCTPETKALFAMRTPGPAGESNSSERRLSAALAHTLRTSFNPEHVETEYRIGNSYCDVLGHFGDVVWVFEVKKGELTTAAVSQVQRYREALREQWPTKTIAAALLGRSLGRIADEAKTSDLSVVIYDQGLNCSVVCPSNDWRFPVNFLLSHEKLTVIQHTRAPAREEANANGLRQEATANANGQRLPAKTGIGGGVLAGSLPRDHIGHAVCGRMCLLDRQFAEFVGKFGGDQVAAATAVRTWAVGVLEDWDRPPKLNQPMGGGTFAWWSARWDEWQGAAKPSARQERSVRQSAECPHDPSCPSPGNWQCQQRDELEATKAEGR